ncbi:hypothetical protein FOXYS1_13694, partial [Fusarium oxysporum]
MPAEENGQSTSQRHQKPSKWRQCSIVIAAFMLNFSGCGLLFCFGIFQSLYEDMSRKAGNPFTGASSAEITLIGSIAASLMKLGAPWATALFKVPLPPRNLVLTRKFLAQSINAFFQSAAYYTPIFYIAAFSKTLGYKDTDGANFTALSNACNAIGKVGVGFIADRIGRLDSFFLTTLLSCTSTAGLWVSSTVLGSSDVELGRALFITFTVVYGLFASAYIGLFSPALVELFGISEMPHITGIMYMLQGAAGLMGTPLAGFLVTESTSPGSYLYMAVLVGSFMFISTVSVQWARIELMVERAGGKWQWTWGLSGRKTLSPISYGGTAGTGAHSVVCSISDLAPSPGAEIALRSLFLRRRMNNMAAATRIANPTTGRITARAIVESFERPELESVSSFVGAVAEA